MRGKAKSIAKRLLGVERLARVRKKLIHLASLCHRGNLTRLAYLHGSDKAGSHFYTQHYQTFFAGLRGKPLSLLEIGVGGYEDPLSGGSSLRMWKYFFPYAQIFSLDIHDKRFLEEERIRIFQGSQDDPEVLARIASQAGPFDIIIDDGSHQNAHVIFSFQQLFPHLKPDGWYVVEDTQTSYWSEYGGSEAPTAATTMNFLKQLTDGLNHAERTGPASFLDLNIKSLHFFHNLVFIQRGLNDEPSNVLSRPAASSESASTQIDGVA